MQKPWVLLFALGESNTAVQLGCGMEIKQQKSTKFSISSIAGAMEKLLSNVETLRVLL